MLSQPTQRHPPVGAVGSFMKIRAPVRTFVISSAAYYAFPGCLAIFLRLVVFHVFLMKWSKLKFIQFVAHLRASFCLKNKLRPLIKSEFQVVLYESIALETIYNFAFKFVSIGRSVRSEMYKN
jgi:hypothetical protein